MKMVCGRLVYTAFTP
ncbi:hypothetical protein QO234_21910 [Vibrio vulnificus]|nr:hypothetical protein [Vibrio vulnificus]MCU8479085.1 hypothetical protein [Vibrio vulnificus]MDK2679561.1 hypothetical protein [Vibrio vulnificus]